MLRRFQFSFQTRRRNFKIIAAFDGVGLVDDRLDRVVYHFAVGERHTFGTVNVDHKIVIRSFLDKFHIPKRYAAFLDGILHKLRHTRSDSAFLFFSHKSPFVCGALYTVRVLSFNRKERFCQPLLTSCILRVTVYHTFSEKSIVFSQKSDEIQISVFYTKNPLFPSV